MANIFLVLMVAFLCAINAGAIPFCPEPFRMTMPDGTVKTVRIPCPTEPPLPSFRPRPSPPPRPAGHFTLKTNSLQVIKSSDGFLRGCADPLIYVLYARVIPGLRGSTIGRKLARIDYGEGRCSGRFISKVGGITSDIVPTDRVSLSAYVVIGIEEDNAGTSTVNKKMDEQLRKLKDLLRKLETEEISPLLARIALDIPSLIDSKFEIPKIKKPSDGFLNLGHDFVGFNALLLVGGSGYSGQPVVCNRADFPICVNRDLGKGIVVGGKVDKNVWRANVQVDAA